MKVLFVVISLSLVLISDAKHSKNSCEKKYALSRVCKQGEEKTKKCSECTQIAVEQWRCPVNVECAVIRNVKSTKCSKNSKKRATCPVKIVPKKKCFDKQPFLDYQNSTKEICVKEECFYKYVETKCPEHNVSTIEKVQFPDKNEVDSEDAEDKITEDSGDLFTEEDIERLDFKCKPNKSFRLGCNTCWCKSDGKAPKYCTRIACNPKTYKPLPYE